MNLIKRISGQFSESANVKLSIMDQLAVPIAQAAERMAQSLKLGGKIMSCGNGGSAADAQHFAAELLNRFERERAPLSAMALTTDSSTLTSIANDYDFSLVFAKQVRALGRQHDLLLGISTSGNSRNIIEAINAAHEKGISVVALTGHSGGKMAGLLTANDIHICVPESSTKSTGRIQEVHLLTLHCLCDALDCIMMGVE